MPWINKFANGWPCRKSPFIYTVVGLFLSLRHWEGKHTHGLIPGIVFIELLSAQIKSFSSCGCANCFFSESQHFFFCFVFVFLFVSLLFVFVCFWTSGFLIHFLCFILLFLSITPSPIMDFKLIGKFSYGHNSRA